MSSQLTSELKKQKQLYDELLRKTQQLQRLQTVSRCFTYPGQASPLFPSSSDTRMTWTNCIVTAVIRVFEEKSRRCCTNVFHNCGSPV